MTKPLLHRMILAMVENLTDTDPFVTIAIDDNEIRITWPKNYVDFTNNIDCEYPRDYSDRQLAESTWRKIDGLTAMIGNGCPKCTCERCWRG